MQGNVISIVRSTIENEQDRAAFDHWYSTDHMPKVIARLKPEEGWRFWSINEPAIHCAVYRYRNRDAIMKRSAKDYADLVEEYNERWPGITRTNEWLEAAEHILPR